MGRYDDAIGSELKCLQRQPKSFFARTILGWAYEQKKMYPEATAELREAVKLTNAGPFALAAYGHALAISGDTRGARDVIAQLQEKAKSRYVSAYDVSMVYAGLGDKDEAFKWLDKAEHDHASLLPYITWDRRADYLRPDPRFRTLLQRLGLPQTAMTTPLPAIAAHVPATLLHSR